MWINGITVRKKKKDEGEGGGGGGGGETIRGEMFIRAMCLFVDADVCRSRSDRKGAVISWPRRRFANGFERMRILLLVLLNICRGE